MILSIIKNIASNIDGLTFFLADDFEKESIDFNKLPALILDPYIQSSPDSSDGINSVFNIEYDLKFLLLNKRDRSDIDDSTSQRIDNVQQMEIKSLQFINELENSQLAINNRIQIVGKPSTMFIYSVSHDLDGVKLSIKLKLISKKCRVKISHL